MKHIYLDWNIFSNSKKPETEPYISIRKLLNETKANYVIPFSDAHLQDLRKGYNEQQKNIDYTNQDLKLMREIFHDYLWYYSEDCKGPKILNTTPEAAFEKHREKQETNEILALHGLELWVKQNPGERDLDAPIQTIDFNNIPHSDVKTALLNFLPGLAKKDVTLRELAIQLAQFSDEININPKKYTELRKGIRTSAEIGNHISMWRENVWEKLDEYLPKTIFRKTFTQIVNDAIYQNNKNDDTHLLRDTFLHAFTCLDMIGYQPDTLNKKNTYLNFYNDSQHVYFAQYCDVFVSQDETTRNKAKVIYEKFKVTTEVLSPEEFLTKLIPTMNVVELFERAPNGLKLNHLLLTKVSNEDKSDFDYIIEYVDFCDNRKMLIGKFDLILGHVMFFQTKASGVPHGALRLLANWINENREQ